jgi:hypothetical protein
MSSKGAPLGDGASRIEFERIGRVGIALRDAGERE